MADTAAFTPELVLNRFCGREVYPIINAHWNLYTDSELQIPTFCVHLEAGLGTILSDDTHELDAEPWWELNYIKSDLTEFSLVQGAVFCIPAGYDESQKGHLTNFYYCEHESSEANFIEIVAVDGERLLLRLRGETVDVNFYDGSKAPTELFVEAWFTRDQETFRSMS